MKYCPQCKETKPPEDFYPIKLKRKAGRVDSGLAPYCRKCSNQRASRYRRERYHADAAFRAKHNRKTAEGERRRRAADPEYVKVVSARVKQKRLEKKRAEAAAGAGQVQPKLCIDCGADIAGRHGITKYCPDCKQSRRQATVRKYSLSRSRKATAKGEV